MTPFFGAAVCIGVMAVCVRLAAPALSPLQIAFVRFAGSLLALLLATGVRGLRPRPGNLLRVAQRGLLGAASIVCYFAAIARAGAGLATLLNSTYPLWTGTCAVLFLGEPLTLRLVAALALSAVGAAIALSDRLAAGPTVVSGVLIGLLGGALAGAAIATAGQLRRTESATLVTVWFMALGALVTAPSMLEHVAWPSARVAAALGGVVVTSAAGQWLLHHGLGFVSPTVGSLAAATSVVTAAGLEGLLLGEHLDARVAVGAVLMLVAVALVARPPAAVARQAGTTSG